VKVKLKETFNGFRIKGMRMIINLRGFCELYSSKKKSQSGISQIIKKNELH